MHTLRRLLLALLVPACLSLNASSLPVRDTLPLKSAAPEGLGLIGLRNTLNTLLGASYVHGGARPDVFLTGSGGARNLFLFKYLRDDANGVPVFDEPVLLNPPPSWNGNIFQAEDGTTLGYWLQGGEIVHSVFNPETLTFEPRGSIALNTLGLPRSPRTLSASPNKDGSVDIVFEMPDGTPSARGDAWTDEWRPYSSTGAWTGPRNHVYLHSVRLSSANLGEARLLDSRQASVSQREIYNRSGAVSPANLGKESGQGFVSGSRLGSLFYYPAAKPDSASSAVAFGEKHLISGVDGNGLRDTATNANVVSYYNPATGRSDILVAGEGVLKYYQSTGDVTRTGAPVFKGPFHALQRNADLLSGALPSPTAIDWDGDGLIDILVGNSEGVIVFHKNTGTNENPAFTETSLIHLADGRLLHVEAGYSGSLQGLGESHWGYLSPNVFDWNNDGLPDILTGDITGNYHVYINKGTKENPALAAPHLLYCDGVPLRGVWRARPAVAHLGDRTMLIIADDLDRLHLYWRIDDINVQDGGILTLDDGSPITVSGASGGASGRCKLDLVDWDGDGRLDLVIGTSRRNAIPNPESGYPFAALGPRAPGTVLFMKNVGTNEQPVFKFPVPLRHKVTNKLIQPGGAHESGAVGTALGGGGPNLLAGDESGRLYLYFRENLEPTDAE